MVKKQGFTIIESVMSMIILVFIGIAALPVLTKTAPRIESTSIRGQYGCWYEGNTLKQWYLDERTPRTTEPENVDTNVGCILRLDQRPANFYILATGAGGNSTPAQTIATYTPSISNQLFINLGTTNGDKTTTISSGTTSEFAAKGPETTYNHGIIPDNIKSCKLIKARNSAPDDKANCKAREITNFNYDGSLHSTGWGIRINGYKTNDGKEVLINNIDDIISTDKNNSNNSNSSSSSSSNPSNKVEYRYVTDSYVMQSSRNISGTTTTPTLTRKVTCRKVANAKPPFICTVIETKKVPASISGYMTSANTSDIGDILYNFNNVNQGNINKLAKSNLHHFKAQDKDGNWYEFNLEFYDSSYGRNNSIVPIIDVNSSSKMTKLLELISLRRKSKLIDRLIDSNPGGINKNGAVLILW